MKTMANFTNSTNPTLPQSFVVYMIEDACDAVVPNELRTAWSSPIGLLMTANLAVVMMSSRPLMASLKNNCWMKCCQVLTFLTSAVKFNNVDLPLSALAVLLDSEGRLAKPSEKAVKHFVKMLGRKGERSALTDGIGTPASQCHPPLP